MGIYSTSKSLVSQWAEGTKRKLQARGRPNTKVDSGGTQSNYTFDGQEISRSELRDVKEMRESGGVVSHLVHAKAMMQFGPGATFHAEEDDASEWLEEQFNDLDNLLIDLGEDATWFPYALAEIVETQGGDFSHVELVEPWTTLPVENEVGEVIAWEQEIKGDFQSTTETFEPDEIASFVLNKSSGRDKTGVSEVLRAEDEITHFKENQKVMNDALEYLVPHHHWIIGSEGQSVIDDNELRRFRNRIDSMKGDTQIISGPGVKHEQIDLPKFDIKEITNNDLRQLCVALGVPIELASVISEGLGSGEQSSARQVFFELEKDAKQRALGGQFVEQIARILLRDYSSYDPEQNLDLVFNDARTQEERKTTVDAIGDDLTANERRKLFEYSELDDEEKGESFDSPGEESQDDPFGGGGGSGFFSDGRQLQSVPDNATSIDSPDECDGNVVEGPRGGMYCVPSGDGGGEETDGDSTQEGQEISIDEVEPGDEVMVDAQIEGPDGEMVDISGDEVEVADVDPDIGMLIDHPEYGRGDVRIEDINGIVDPNAEPEGGEEDEGPTGQTTDANHDEFEETFSLENSVDEQDLSEMGVSMGKTAESMSVHEMDDGSTAFVKEFGEDAIDPERRDRTLVGYEVMKQVAPDQVPSHAVIDDGERVATEGVSGEEVWDVDEETAASVDEETYIRGAAAQVLMGNDDARAENVIIQDDGTPAFVDLDEAATDQPSDMVMGVAIQRAARTYGELAEGDWREASQDAAEQIGEQVKQLKDDVDIEELENVSEEHTGPIEEIVNSDDETIDAAVEEAQRQF